MAESDQSRHRSTRTYRSSPHVAWTVETTGIRLLDQASGTVRLLGYPEAAVWDLVSRGRDFDSTVSMLQAIGSLDRQAAERLVRRSLVAWSEAGFLQEC